MARAKLQEAGTITQFYHPYNIEIFSPPSLDLNDFRIAVNIQKATYDNNILIAVDDVATINKKLSDLTPEVIAAVETTLLSLLGEKYPGLELLSIYDGMGGTI